MTQEDPVALLELELLMLLWLAVLSLLGLVNQGLSQGLQHLPFVVVKVSIDLVDCTVLHHPELALSLCDESGIVTHNDHRWREAQRKIVCHHTETEPLVFIRVFAY